MATGNITNYRLYKSPRYDGIHPLFLPIIQIEL